MMKIDEWILCILCMPDTIIDTLPTLSDQSCWLTLQERSEKSCENSIFSTQRCCQRNMPCIVGSIFMIGILIGVLVIVLSNTNPIYPCMSYSQQSLASSVSVACLQYMWTQSCSMRSPYTFSPTYMGWWNQSPEGTAMVPCNGLKKGAACGVGSYSNMITYMQLCNINLNQ